MTADLATEVEAIRAALVRHAELGADVAGEHEQHPAAPEEASRPERSRPSPPQPDAPQSDAQRPKVYASSGLASVIELFQLSPFEKQILVLCAGIELDASFAALCAKAQADPDRGYPTFGLALAAFPDRSWRALLPSSPLRFWRLIHLAPGGGLTAAALRIDERILHRMVDLETRDEWLFDRLEPVLGSEPSVPGSSVPGSSVPGSSVPEQLVPEQLVPSHARVASRIAATWSEAVEDGRALPVVQLCGDVAASKRAIAGAVAKELGLTLYRMDAEVLPAATDEREELLRRWRRESLLAGAALLLDVRGSSDDPALEARLRSFIERSAGPLLISRGQRMPPFARPSLVVEVEKPTHAEQRRLWAATLGDTADSVDLDRLVAQFHLEASDIPAIELVARGDVRADRSVDREEVPGPVLDRALWTACRQQARPRLDDLAQRVDPRASWADLVLPPPQLRQLREIVAHVGQRSRVFDRWGFGDSSVRGLGVSALFAGTSGTGKTMAAEVLAGDLDLDLYRIDLSSVVSKYIGETEKNLRRVFDAAEEGGAILLFDEADALFGKRSEVKDSHDRYANVEISYLLQRVETYRGLAILTSNFKEALDAAFLRRLRFIIELPFPDRSERREMWRRVFPPQAPTEGLDLDALAQLDLTGGNIRSIALAAAFVAAAADRPIRMPDLRLAVHRELAKLGKPLSESDTRSWQS